MPTMLPTISYQSKGILFFIIKKLIPNMKGDLNLAAGMFGLILCNKLNV